MLYNWPKDYPKNCPDDLKENPGKYYRCIKNNRAIINDFYSPYQLGKPRIHSSNICENRSISIFSNIDDAINVIHQYPNFSKKFVVELNLRGNHGVIHRSPNNDNSHHDWWIPDNVNPLMYCGNIQGSF